MIPHKIHFVWSGKRFPLPFALAIRSARRVHPDWDIQLHIGTMPESPWWDEVRDLGTVRPLVPEALLESVQGIGTQLVDLHRAVPSDYPAGRSNLERLAILQAEGGWYLDCDTLCLSPLDAVATDGEVVGEEWVWRHDQQRVTSGFHPVMIPSISAFSISWALARCGVPSTSRLEAALRKAWGRLELNNAVLASPPDGPWIRRLLELALTQDPAVRFALGPGLVNLGWERPGNVSRPRRMGPQAFYQFPPSQTSRYFQHDSPLPAGAVVLHWCSSNHRKMVQELTPQLVRDRAGWGPWYREAARFLSA
ncbi:MAG TPA: glycosyltransferase [Fibrobacteria bacterium]|nr:glycosyltransferase [Fibrobacteria bacterium]